jgi:cyclic beta-1,2-glucan synthetase
MERVYTNREEAACEWYLRGFFDDGTPLGSGKNTECRIDSIAQSRAVISGSADLARASRAMSAVEQQLVRREDGLVARGRGSNGSSGFACAGRRYG